MRNIKIVLEYEGTSYHGWQRQKNGVSIQQTLEEKAAIITGEGIKVIGSGRTDAGVHAIGQVANFRTTSSLESRKLKDGINSLLPRDIVIRSLVDVDASFHARKNAISKIYVYQICNRPVRPAINRNFVWAVYKPLDIDGMRQAAGMLKGRHDFTSFSTVHTDVEEFTRTIMDTRIETGNDGMIRVYVEADGFLRYMVRTIVGTLVEMGNGKRNPSEMVAIIDAKDRKRAGMTAPAQGLFLKEVKYA
jgi:tRNA pseudouridine38-40 synthase